MSRSPRVGDTIEWASFELGGVVRTRSGQVWSLAPVVPRGGGARPVAPLWVVAEDNGEAVYVATAGKNGARLGHSLSPLRPRVEAGTLYSEIDDLTPSGAMTEAANRQSRRRAAQEAAA